MPEPIAETLVDDLQENQPDVQQNAVQAEADKDRAVRDQWADLRDRQGLPFDPAIHKVNSAGEPTTTKLGKLIRKPGRKPGSGAGQSTLSKGDTKASTQDSGQNARAIAAAATVDSIGTLGGMLGGSEWLFQTNKEQGIDERQRGIEAFEQYYTAKGIDDIPPGVIVLAWVVSYATPRIMGGEQTRSKLARARDWVLSKVFKRRAAASNPVEQKESDTQLEA